MVDGVQKKYRCRYCGEECSNLYLRNAHSIHYEKNPNREKIYNKIRQSVKALWKDSEYAKRQSESHLRYYKNHEVWDKGKTKETDDRLLAISKKLKGRKISREWADKISKAHKGKPRIYSNPEETARKISESKKGKRTSPKTEFGELWKNPKIRKKIQKALHRKPNKLEKSFDKVFPRLKYVGDLSFFVGCKNPDFILPDSSFAVDLFGDYWHKDDDPRQRIEYFKSHGFHLEIVWENEWWNNRKVVVDRISGIMEDFSRVV